MTGDPKAERQYRILVALRSTGWVSAQSLAERLDVSIRTIYRDVEDLLSCGIPIEGVRGPEGGYRLRPGVPVDPALLSSVDSFALSIERGRGVSVPEAHLREIPEALRNRMFFDTSDWYLRGQHSEWLQTSKDAVAACNAVQFNYRERDSTERRNLLVMPYGLVWKGGEWYLVGPEVSGPIQRFSLGRIDALVATALTFPMPSDFNIGATWAQLSIDFGRGDQKIVFQASEKAKQELLRLQLKPDSQVEQRQDGSIQITLFVDSWQWLVPLIASFGPAVRVLEPTELRESVIRFFRDALSAYDDSISQERDNAHVH